MPPALNLLGRHFGRLTVVERATNSSRGETRWLCKCQCGGTSVVERQNLQTGHTRSCGCLIVEGTIRRSTKHSRRKSPEYYVWQSLIARCTNPKRQDFNNYGGRGIGVCARWRKSFAAFLSDMGPRPSPGHTIDRINNNGHYSPSNCRWATRPQQARNRRGRIKYRGQLMTITEAVEIAGVTNRTVVFERISNGWPIRLAIETPTGVRRKRASR